MRTLAIVALTCAVFASCAVAEVTVATHIHTQYSDGYDSMTGAVANAQKAGAQAVVVSDHAEMVNSEYVYYNAYGGAASVDNRFILSHKEPGVDGWARSVSEQYPIPVIPGMEVGLGEGRKSHLLFWGGLPECYRRVVSLAEVGANLATVPRNLAIHAEANGAVLVQAHPCSSEYPFTAEVPVSGATYGVEFFNCFNSESEQARTFNRLLELQAGCANAVIATAGSDWHGGYDQAMDVLSCLGEAATRFNLTVTGMRFVFSNRDEGAMYRPSLCRHTIVQSDNHPRAIMSAIMEGRCYASFEPDGASHRVVDASVMPGGRFQPTDQDSNFWMKIRGLGSTDEVRIGLVSKTGRIRNANLTGGNHTEGGIGILGFDLREICSREDNTGWWLFVMTPRIVTSAIEILPWSGQEETVSAPPPDATQSSAPAQSQDPWTLISGYPHRYIGSERNGPKLRIKNAWVGVAYEPYGDYPYGGFDVRGAGIIAVDYGDDNETYRAIIEFRSEHLYNGGGVPISGKVVDESRGVTFQATEVIFHLRPGQANRGLLLIRGKRFDPLYDRENPGRYVNDVLVVEMCLVE